MKGANLIGFLREPVLWTLQLALAAVFLNAAWRKFTGHEVPLATFQSLGMDPWFRYMTGMLEFADAIGLLIRPLSGLAALGLACVIIGAIVTHLFFVPDSIVPAFALLVALCVVSAGRLREILFIIGRVANMPMK